MAARIPAVHPWTSFTGAARTETIIAKQISGGVKLEFSSEPVGRPAAWFFFLPPPGARASEGETERRGDKEIDAFGEPGALVTERGVLTP